ncbi:MAG: glycosyltransferase [Ignavibacteriaceae bacterium]
MEKKPRLLIYTVSWNKKRNLLFSRQLSEYFEVMILTSFKGDKKFFDLIKPVKVFHIKYRFKNNTSLSFSNKFKYYLQEYNPDYVLTSEIHSVSSYQSAKLSKKFNYKPVVFNWLNASSKPKFFITKFIQKKVLARTDYLLAGTPLTKNFLLKKEKVFINPESGYDEKILFVFVGKGELENKIKIFDSQNLYFRGSYDFTDMGKVFRSCNIFVYPSLSTKNRTKQFNYSVIEAQACGKPVIISVSGNLNSFVNDGVNGSVIKEGDEQSLTEKILLWCDKLQIDRENFEFSASRFSGRNIALNYKKILMDSDPSLLNNWF